MRIKITKQGFIPIHTLLLISFVLGVTIIAFAYLQNPLIVQNLVTSKIPIMNIAPAYNLKGTWISTSQGKGIQLQGQFTTASSSTKVYEDGDIELIINSVERSIASGTIHFTNMCLSGETTVPGRKSISIPKQCISDSGTQPISIKVIDGRLDFGTVKAGNLAFTMQSNFTNDTILGSITVTTPYGNLQGEFHLTRLNYQK